MKRKGTVDIGWAEYRIEEFKKEFNDNLDLLIQIRENGVVFEQVHVPLILRNLQCLHDAQLHWRNCLETIEKDNKPRRNKIENA